MDESSVDTTLTEAKAQKEKAKRLRLDSGTWRLIKRLYQEGQSIRLIAEAYGVTESAIYSKATRQDWPRRSVTIAAGKERARVIETPKPEAVKVPEKAVAEAVKEAVQAQVQAQVPALQAKVRERIETWFNVVTSNANRLQEHITDKTCGPLEVEEIKSLSSSLSSLHGTMRQVFGLDGADGCKVAAMITASPAIACPIIDIDSLPEATPATVATGNL